MKKRIGELLLDAGVITESIIEEALSNKREDQKIGDYLVEKGYVKEDILYEKLSEQLKIPLFRLKDMSFKTYVLNALDKEIIKRNLAFPVEISGSLLTVAMADPLDEKALKEIEDSVEYDVVPVLALKSEILDYINKYYDIDDSIQEFFDIREDELDTKDELQVADMIYSILVEQRKWSVVIYQNRGVFHLLKGYVEADSSRDLSFIVNFVSKITGYSSDKEEARHESVYTLPNGSRMKFNLVVLNKGVGKEFWIEANLIEKENVGSNVKENEVLLEIPGVYLVLNRFFEHNKEFKNFLVGLNQSDRFKDSVIVCSDDISYEALGLKILNTIRERIVDFSGFGDVFVLEKGWKEEYIDTVLGLLSKGKVVIIQVPFVNEQDCRDYFMEIKNGRVILNLVKDLIIF